MAERICWRHAKRGNYERLTRATVTPMLEEHGVQEGEMHTQLVGHTYAGIASSLARAAVEMCSGRPLEVHLPELALNQAADLLARPDGMCAADRACDKYLRKAVAQAHTLWDKAAHMVDAARPHSVTNSLMRHQQERRDEQQRQWEQERRAEQERHEEMERQQVSRKLAEERRRREREASDKRKTNARSVAVAARQETWERDRTLAPSARSRRRRCHRHRGKGAPRDALRSAAADFDFDKARRVDTQAGSALGDALKVFRRGEIVSEARRTRQQRLRQQCREASARAAVLKAEAVGLE